MGEKDGSTFPGDSLSSRWKEVPLHSNDYFGEGFLSFHIEMINVGACRVNVEFLKPMRRTHIAITFFKLVRMLSFQDFERSRSLGRNDESLYRVGDGYDGHSQRSSLGH